MIEYSLSKQLKDAGYPQGFDISSGGEILSNPDTDRGSREFCYAPTLSQLIESLGDSRYFSLERDAKQSYRATWDKEGVGDYVSDICSTPEEAVVNLYLELNKKS